jgi:hypothetical protein
LIRIFTNKYPDNLNNLRPGGTITVNDQGFALLEKAFRQARLTDDENRNKC